MALILKFGTKIDGQAFGRVSGVKKQRRATAKHKRHHTQPASHNAGRGRNASASLNSGIRNSARLKSPALARVEVYSSDERQALALLVLPFLLMTFAIGISQSVKRSGPLPEIAILSPTAPTKASAARPSSLTGLYRKFTRANVEARTPDAVSDVASPVSSPSISTHALTAPTANAKPPQSAATVASLPRTGAANAVTPGAPATMAEVSPATTREPIAAPAVEIPNATKLASVDVGTLLPQITIIEPRRAPDLTSATALEQPIETFGRGAPSANICTVAAARFAQPVRLGQTEIAIASDAALFGRSLAAAARTQIDDLVVYTDRYRRLAYPMGDVASLYGVCTDVVIRAYRSVGLDLQKLVHETRVGSGDTSIEHRRVETLRRFFATHGLSLPASEFAEDYKPGDIVTYYRPQNRHSRSHIAIVADEIGASGNPMIIHNRGWGPQLEDGLFVDQITGHYRFAGLRSKSEPRLVASTERREKGTRAQPVTARSGGQHATEPAVERGVRRGSMRGAHLSAGCTAGGSGSLNAACATRQARTSASTEKLETR